MTALKRNKILELLKEGKTPEEITSRYVAEGYSRGAVTQVIRVVIANYSRRRGKVKPLTQGGNA